jgi:hypothetical protein
LECAEFQAVFLSPRVHRLLQQDRSVNSIFVELKGESAEATRIIGYFDKLMQGFEVRVNDCDVGSVLEVASFLGNTELITEVLEAKDPLSAQNVLSRLETQGFEGCRFERAIDFAASHLYELDLGRVKRMPYYCGHCEFEIPALGYGRFTSGLHFGSRM